MMGLVSRAVYVVHRWDCELGEWPEAWNSLPNPRTVPLCGCTFAGGSVLFLHFIKQKAFTCGCEFWCTQIRS